jgi:endogenous inhibitor of DNA gyrase (YacG/DUF329 family)
MRCKREECPRCGKDLRRELLHGYSSDPFYGQVYKDCPECGARVGMDGVFDKNAKQG